MREPEEDNVFPPDCEDYEDDYFIIPIKGVQIPVHANGLIQLESKELSQ